MCVFDLCQSRWKYRRHLRAQKVSQWFEMEMEINLISSVKKDLWIAKKIYEEKIRA